MALVDETEGKVRSRVIKLTGNGGVEKYVDH